MSDYIKRDDARGAIASIYTSLLGVNAKLTRIEATNKCYQAICNIPAADVVERRRGTWVPFAAHAALGTFVKCSECGQTGDASWRGCPRCLAIMGGNDE